MPVASPLAEPVPLDRAPVARRGAAVPWWVAPVGLACAAPFAVPFADLVVDTLRQPAEIWGVIASSRTLEPLWRTIQLAVIVTVASVVVGTGMAWLTVRGDIPARRFWQVASVLPLVIPSYVGAHAFVSAFAPGGLVADLVGANLVPEVRGLPAAAWVLTTLSYPYVYLPVAARLSGLSPSLEESARLLGRRPATVFLSVVLPQCALAIAAGALLVALYVISDFGAVQFVGYDTLTRQIYGARFDRTAAVAFSLLLAVVAIVLTLVERGVARRVPQAPVMSMRRAVTVQLGRWRVPAMAAVALVVLATLVAPLVVLCWWVWQGVVNDTPRFPDDGLIPPLVGSTWVSIAAALIAIAVVLPIARLTVRHQSRSGAAASTFVVSGFALPGIVIALSLVNLFVATPLYQTYVVLLAAYVIHFGGQALRASQVAVAAVPVRMEEAARLLGASRWRRLWTVEVPIMLPGLAAGAGLVLLNTMKELPATLLLAPVRHESLSGRIWQTAEQVYRYDVATTSLVLIGCSAVLTWWLVIRRMERVVR
jgi:iron(III) transport system permease protein